MIIYPQFISNSMSYKIPNDEDVVIATQRVILRLGTVNSQVQLKKLVQDELRKIDNSYNVGAVRVRSLALKSRYIRVEIKYRTWPNHKTKLKHCPVCSEIVQKIKNKTLTGEVITIGYKCKNCPYHSDFPIKIPARYIFSARKL
jgi:hypothetical protein